MFRSSHRLIRRLGLEVVDSARNSRTLREAMGWWLFFRAALTVSSIVRAFHLSRAIAYAESLTLRQACKTALCKRPGIDGRFAIWREVVLQSPRHRQRLTDGPHLDRSILLKAPQSETEKGLLLITFEYNWVRLLIGLGPDEWEKFESRYDLILSTSWSPTDYAALSLVLSRTRGTIFIQSCNRAEIATIEAFHPRLRCLPTMPCDWINPNHYESQLLSKRDIDLIMVANWGQFKRHWELFKALAFLPPSLKVVLVGQREPGRSMETINQLARDFGVPQTLVIHESLSIDEVTRLQCRSKASVIMTRREGCCVAAVESLFAGCSLAMREDAHIGPVVYINDQTGVLLRAGRIAEDLMILINGTALRDPSKWACREISAEVSKAKVDTFLEQQARAQNRPWTRGICLPQWRPHPSFAISEECVAMAPFYYELHKLDPDVFPADLAVTSWR